MPIDNDCPKDSDRLIASTPTRTVELSKDQWAQAQAVVNLVMAAEDVCAGLEYANHPDTPASVARLRACLKAME